MANRQIRTPEDSAVYKKFFEAVGEGHVKQLTSALHPSINIDALEADPLEGRAALHLVAQSGNVPSIQLLLDHGVTVDIRNSEGETLLHEAAFAAHPEAIKTLLDAGADIDLPTDDYNYTALHNVLKCESTVTPRHIESIELLLDRGSN